MKGLALARAYFDAYGAPMIERQFAAYKSSMAVGLVGEGSECFGYDDAFSQDHDFGPGFCIWLPQTVYAEIGAELERAYAALPQEYLGYRRLETAQAGKRVGVWSIEQFYQRFTGIDHPPRDNMEWFRIPEEFLAICTNGQIFWDAPGIFSEWRNELLAFYPQDVVKKKLAARCANMAQAGQYNYGRSMRRGDQHAAYLDCGIFVRNALAAIYLLNEHYAPFYKWIFRGTEHHRLLRETVDKLKMLTLLADTPENASEKEGLIEQICVDIVGALNSRGFTRTSEPFLQVQAEELMRSIADSRLRALHILADATAGR